MTAHHHHYEHPGEQHRGSKTLGLAFLLTGGFTIIEIAGGWLFNSLALLADGGHMLSDTLALGMAWFALRIGQLTADDTHTFGFRRGEILAAFLNGLMLWVMVVFIAYEAFERFTAPKQIAGVGMLVTASIGLIVNILLILVLAKDRRQTLNQRGAFLHVLSDTLGSIGAVSAGIVVITFGLYWFDSLISLFICLLILYSSFDLLRESVNILLEGVPADLNIKEIEEAIHRVRGICCVYDLHIWSISTNQNALSVHVVMGGAERDKQTLLSEINGLLRDRFQISHSTIQLESTHEMRAHNGQHRCRVGTECRVGNRTEV